MWQCKHDNTNIDMYCIVKIQTSVSQFKEINIYIKMLI